MIPRTDDALVSSTKNWLARLPAAPADFGVSAAQAQTYAGLANQYLNAVTTMQQARAKGIWSRAETITRDQTREALLGYARELYTQIKANSAVSIQNKILLGIHVREGAPSRVQAPGERPGVMIKNVVGRMVEVSIYDAQSSRTRPAGAVQAIVYYFAGDSYASDLQQWQFAGLATKRKFAFHVPNSVDAGMRVWIQAAWTNRRGVAGPTNAPVSTHIQGGGISPLPMCRAA